MFDFEDSAEDLSVSLNFLEQSLGSTEEVAWAEKSQSLFSGDTSLLSSDFAKAVKAATTPGMAAIAFDLVFESLKKKLIQFDLMMSNDIVITPDHLQRLKEVVVYKEQKDALLCLISERNRARPEVVKIFGRVA